VSVSCRPARSLPLPRAATTARHRVPRHAPQDDGRSEHLRAGTVLATRRQGSRRARLLDLDRRRLRRRIRPLLDRRPRPRTADRAALALRVPGRHRRGARIVGSAAALVQRPLVRACRCRRRDVTPCPRHAPDEHARSRAKGTALQPVDDDALPRPPACRARPPLPRAPRRGKGPRVGSRPHPPSPQRHRSRSTHLVVIET
jgi:hypothetical protein